jgi:REP element-mobilizing transposase RayT
VGCRRAEGSPAPGQKRQATRLAASAPFDKPQTLFLSAVVPKRGSGRHLPHLSPFQAQPIVFLTLVTQRRRALLANAFAHRLLRGIWERSGEANGWFVGDYVLMPDHVHLFASPGLEADALSAWVKLWKSVSSRQLKHSECVAPPIWQPEYFDRFLRSDESYEEKWWYVRENPVRAGLATDADAWPYRGRIVDLPSVTRR